jgi:S-formylglutathione hydrolase FrmB
MKKIILFVLLCSFCSIIQAARVDSIKIRSEKMGSDVKTIVIVPDAALGAKAKKCPVVYLLHGYMGDETSWLGIKPNLPKIADEKGIIFVCPDGKNNWYIDSPMNKSSQYETFISKELINYIDKNYNSLNDRKYRAITGLSMGGHGALYNAFRHKDVFGAAGSMSGAVDVSFRLENLGLKELLGEDKANWENASVMTQIGKISNNDLAIYIDCGVSDFLFDVNEKLNKVLWENDIDHDYTTRQGVHDAPYWNNSLDYHILFFCKFFFGENFK